MKKIVTAKTGHTMCVLSIKKEELPENIKEHVDTYSKFYVVKNWDEKGVAFFYLAKGHSDAPNEICGWYRNGQFWSSYGDNFQAAIDGLISDGWLYAK